MKAIIFGANGQDGRFMQRLLHSHHIAVTVVSRSGNYERGDVKDVYFVNERIRSIQADYIFHFAADSTSKHESLFSNHDSISTGTLNILEAVRLYSPHSRVFLSGSALQFRNIGLPINEVTPFEAKSAYAVARIHSVYAARYFRDKFGIKIYIGYFFNHDSEYRSVRHVNMMIIDRIKRIESGALNILEIGDIEVEKEFNYAADIVEAVWILVNQDFIFEAVLGSGEGFKIKEWIEYNFTRIGKSWQNYIVINNEFSVEYKRLVSDPTIIKRLGWEKKTSFIQLADLMWNAV